MAKKFFNPKGAKNIGSAAMNTVAVGAGAVGGALLVKKVIKDKVPEKYHGFLLLALGILGPAFVEQPIVKNLLTGLGVYGALKLTAQYAIKDGSLGISGPEEFGALGASTGALDWQNIREEARVNGLGEAVASQLYGGDEVNGLSALAELERMAA